ncbi:MFS transporter [Kiloniella laminariae]|uniref:MFS transporter n=1 Tax=Kiloniella laminariae TaxID=454162 RepID=A0ABT4LFS1_9PROT|nr:MFS transporter [Kiloniella laminariae]MCZ4279948.1 MFS transporter [Kiloniella laminariae]
MFLLWRCWSAFTALIATVLCILALLSVLQHNALLSDLIHQRLNVITQSLATSFSPVTDPGLPLSGLDNAHNLLVQAKSLDPEIEAIHVFTPNGTPVHSSQAQFPARLSLEDLDQRPQNQSGNWALNTEEHLKSYRTLFDTNKKAVGTIEIIYAKQTFKRMIDRVSWTVTIATAALLLIFSLLTFLIFRLRLARAIKGARMLHNWLLTSKNNHPPRPGDPDLDPQFLELQQDLLTADKNYTLLKTRLAETAEATQAHPVSTDQPDLTDQTVQIIMSPLTLTSLGRSYGRQLLPWAISLILLSALSLGFVTYKSIDSSLAPELSRRTELIAQIASSNIQRSIDAGVMLEQMIGLEDYFDKLLANFPEVSFFGVATGKLVFQAGDWQHSLLPTALNQSQKMPVYPLTASGEQIGYLLIDPSSDYIALQFRSVALDLLVVILVVLLLAYETMTLVMTQSLTSPLNRLKHLARLQADSDFSNHVRQRRGHLGEALINHLSDRVIQINQQYRIQRDKLTRLAGQNPEKCSLVARLQQQAEKFHLGAGKPRILTFPYINDIRLALFLFAAADEIALSFFPIFTRAAENPLTWIDPAIVISLPLAGYLIAYMIATPFSRGLCEKWGPRKFIPCVLTLVLLTNIGMFFATNVIEIILLRTLAGAGYALAVLACQDYVIDMTPRDQRSKSLGIFSAALFGGIYAGTALGGVLADRFGPSAVFMFSAGLILFSALLFYNMIPQGVRVTVEKEPPLTLKSILAPFRNRKFFAVVVGLAIPQSLMDQVFISYLFSLQLDALDASAADIARMLMLYFLTIMISGTILGWLNALGLEDRAIALLGSLLTGTGLLLTAGMPAQWTMLVAAASTGFGHGLLRGPQVELTMKLAETELKQLGTNSVLGALRLFERCGSIVGLLIIAAIAGYLGLAAAIFAIGVIILGGVTLFGYEYFCFSSITQKPDKHAANKL